MKEEGEDSALLGLKYSQATQLEMYNTTPESGTSGEKALKERYLTATVCGLPKFSRKHISRIFNGRPSQKGTTPWIAMLSHLNGQPFCGGSLLARSLNLGVGTNDSLVFQIEIPTVNHDTCQKAYTPLKKKVTKDMICAGEREGGKDSCAGDSGGPMVTKDEGRDQWYLVGVVSWGEDCGKKDRYGVYSYIYPNKDWIQRVTGVRN
ncbi:Mannan-binding lectin serine protease 1 [Cricetulus griseus]|uniref:Mannan-binding lectin serine protease 1 n=1 Tax=Cricetulus griseus TaxID=10029 RepID=G3GT96_CRIGR|nr:Mannan-binding lectin serine protease 1 [Cricetulus griseus]